MNQSSNEAIKNEERVTGISARLFDGDLIDLKRTRAKQLLRPP